MPDYRPQIFQCVEENNHANKLIIGTVFHFNFATAENAKSPAACGKPVKLRDAADPKLSNIACDRVRNVFFDKTLHQRLSG